MAYLGSTVPGFPNFFMIQGTSRSAFMNDSNFSFPPTLAPTPSRYVLFDTGPNTTPGHTSVIFSQESQVSYLLQLLEPLRAGLLKSVAPTDVATDRYNDMLQERFQDTVWSQCASWYRIGGQGRITSLFPGPIVLLWWWLRRIRWEDYEIKGPGVEEWRRRHARWSYSSLLATVSLVGLLVAFMFAILLGVVEPREILKQVVRSYPIFACVEVVRADSRHARLV